jgi:hypothetical protein
LTRGGAWFCLSTDGPEVMRMARWLAALALGGAFVAASPCGAYAQSAKAPAESCFLASDVNGFSAPNDRTVYVEVGVHDVYRLDLMSNCLDLSFRQGVGLEGTPGSPWICSPLDATIVYRQTGVRQRCPVTAIHKLTAAELAAVPKQDRP